MKKILVELKEVLLPLLVIFFWIIILPPFLTFAVVGWRSILFYTRLGAQYYFISCFCNFISQFYSLLLNIYNNIDYKSIQSSLISITFTTLGFAITFRNLLIGRDRDKYFGFSMKSIIKYGTKGYSKMCWYTIICIPFLAIFSYIFGYRRKIFLYTLMSAVCVFIYFFSVLQRIRKEINNEIIAYMFIDNIFDQDKFYHVEYREEMFKKLFCDVNIYNEYNLIFDNVLKIFYGIIYHDDLNKKYGKINKYFKMTSIQLKLCSVVNKKKKHNDELIKNIQTFSLYTFDYYQKIYQHEENKLSALLFIEQFRLFVKNTNIEFTILANSNIFQTYLNRTHTNNDYNTKDEISLRNSNAYILLFNYLLGLLCAGVCFLSISEIKQLISGITEISENNMVLLSKSKIYALVLLVIYYLEYTDNLSKNEKLDYWCLLEYCNDLFINITEKDFIFLKKFLYSEFSINNSRMKFGDIYDFPTNEFQQGHGILLNIFDEF